jgi:ubiquitin-conjugating enzyme E2 Z
MEIITTLAFKRLMKDVREIIKNPIEDNGIYYIHDETNILKGYSLIMGPENTPYAYGNYLFEIDYPIDYPTNPPKFTYLTNGDNIRMNPNFYRSGKVCVSILNTWRGESWSSCQTIKSVLLTLMTILNDTPLLNEPGYSKEDVDFDSYNDILTFKNIDLAIIKILNDKISPDICLKFQMNIHGNFMKNYSKILEIVRAHKFDQSVVSTRVYNMKVDIDYKRLELNLITLYSKLSKIYE